MIVEIIDEPKAKTRRKTFNYIREKNTLQHISKYAVSEAKAVEERAWKITYKVPMEKIQEKDVYEFRFTNNGGFGIDRFSSSELLKEKERKRENVNVENLQNLDFKIESEEVKKFIEELKSFYAPMVSEINNFKMKMSIDYIDTSERAGDYLMNLKYGLASSLCNWPENSRLMSIKQTTKFIHQIWTAIKIHEILNCVRIEKRLHFKQGSKAPASIFIESSGVYWTIWYEPQKIETIPPNYKGPLCNLFEKPAVWKRPDLIVTKGNYTDLLEAEKFGLLIECKNLFFENWWMNGKVIENELIPYRDIFRSDRLVLLSLHSIPVWGEKQLKQERYFVIDEFHPNGSGVSEFKELIGGLIE